MRRDSRPGAGRRRAHQGTVSLPVLRSAQAPRLRGGKSRIARWRAGVLILVHVAIVAHILHWWYAGWSVGRFVLSDSMSALELGQVNPGFLLFIAALILSLIAGRFLCGWACHMGALQDLSAWLLRRMGMRPRLFRARLLGYVPIALALYMFVWPTLAREALIPILDGLWPEASSWFARRPFPGFSADLTTTELWSGLPGWAIAVPFLLLSGVATVYFLGARGLCRYVCPYGGLFFPAEKLAPARVIAQPSLCDQCGLCTANCTAGVRVHEAVLKGGAVFDSNCIRSLDCISVCPQGALALGFVKPSLVGARHRSSPKFDLTLPEEFLSITIFAVVFCSLRGAYDAVPMLLAATLGAIAAFLSFKLVRLFRDPNVRVGGVQLRRAGWYLPASGAFIVGMAIAAALVIQTAAVQVAIHMAERFDDQIDISLLEAMSGKGAPESQRESARQGLSWYAMAAPVWEGGMGLAMTPTVPTREAWMHLVLGDPDAAIERLQMLVHRGLAQGHTGPDLAGLLVAQGRAEEATRTLIRIVEEHPQFSHTREVLAQRLASTGKALEAESLLASAVAARPYDATARAAFARFLWSSGRLENGLTEFARVAADARRNPGIRSDYAIALFQRGRIDEAIAELRSAADAIPMARSELQKMAGNMLRQAGRTAEAASLNASQR